MKSLILFSLFVAGSIAFEGDWIIEPAINGGSEAPPHAYPFMAAIHWVTYTPVVRSRPVCGGVLLSRSWTLTAAHCLTESPRLGDLFVHLGVNTNRRDEPGITRSVVRRQQSIIHPDFRPGRSVGPDDLALLRLDQHVNYSPTIQPIALPQAGTIPTGTTITAGWGSIRRDGQDSASRLQHVELPIITVVECRNILNSMNLNGSVVDYTNFCTGPTPRKSICRGDSGGPAFRRLPTGFVLQGIASWAINPCAHEVGPSGVFKRVSAYIDWIRDNTDVTMG